MKASEYLLVRSEVEAGQVEERERIAVADVEEEMRRSFVVAVLEDLGERELEHSLVEVDRPLHVRADERRVMHTASTRRGTIAARPKVIARDLGAGCGEPVALRCRHPDVQRVFPTGRSAISASMYGAGSALTASP